MMILSYLVNQSDALFWKVVKLVASSISYMALLAALWFNV